MNNRNFSDNIEGTLLVEAFASQNFLRELRAYYLLDRKKYEEIERPFRVFNVLTEEEQEERTKQKTERYYEERPNKTLEEYLREEVGKVNEVYSYMPIPQTASECSQRLKQVTGVMYFEFLKWKFKNKYGTNPPVKAVQEEIKAIEEFINEAELQPISKAYSDPKTWEIDKIKQAYYEYLRVENGYYEHKKVDYTDGNIPCIVFSFCRLFLPYLLKVKNEIENTTPISMKSLSKSMTLYANDWDYYFNVGNSSSDIVNEFIIPTKEYFETGERAGFMDSLQFMNLLWEQIDFLESNRKKPYSTLKHYESLPITEEQRHVLFGFILKFYDGYPFIEINSRKGEGICLLLIEEAFLRYTRDTPEKKYCHNSKVIHDNTNSEYIILEELPQTYTYNAKDFEEISTKYDWDFYHNVDNIANQKGLVLPVRKYFQVGSRGGFIEPLAFLNLMWQQCIYIRTNESKPHSVITHLKLLPINDKVRHILYGMLLKFEVGGYPVAKSSNTPNHNLIMKLIEKEFLNYPEATPEKEFCKQIKYVFKREEYIADTEKVLLENIPREQTKPDRITEELVKYGFFELPKVTALSKNNQQNLIHLITSQPIPFAIAMLDFLGFLECLERNFYIVKRDRDKKIGDLLNTNERTIKGNVNSMSECTKENKKRYTAYKHKEIVIKEYNLLKEGVLPPFCP